MQKIGDIPNTRADSNGEFTDGNVAGGVPPTILPAAWFNTIQRELISVLSAAGITPDSNKFDQVLTAVSKLITDGGFLKTVNNLSEIKTAGAAAVAATLENLGLTGIGIGLPSQTSISNFDFQNFVFTSSGNYLAVTTNWLNAPAGVSYPTALAISITVDYITNSSGQIGLTLVPNTAASVNFKVYKVLCVGALGSRVFTVREEWSSANPVPITGGGTGAITASAALANLGGIGLSQLTGVVGTSRNAKMSIPSASATATFTADELIVQTALGGLQYKISGFSKTVNLATTGAGGMDTGTVPVTGYVALYAIYNPTSGASALLAVNATSVRAPEVYGGANMPSGYTASALVSAWRVASSQFVIGFQRARHISTPLLSVYSPNAGTVAIGAVSFISAVPPNATSINAYLSAYQSTPNVATELSLYSSVSGIGQLRANASVSGGATSASLANGILEVIDQQFLYFNMASTSPAQYGIGCTGYSI